MHVHVCHKCGLPRRNESDVDLGQCMCLGQTWFPYEEKERSVGEAVEIAVRQFASFVALYLRQGRRSFDFKELAERYREPLTRYSQLWRFREEE